MQGRLPGIAESLSAAWAAFLKYPGVLIGIFLVYIVITAGLGAIPGIGTIANFFVMPPLMGGAIVAGMKAVRGQTPEFNDLFVGFRQYWRWVGVYWLFVAILDCDHDSAGHRRRHSRRNGRAYQQLEYGRYANRHDSGRVRGPDRNRTDIAGSLCHFRHPVYVRVL